MNDEVGSALLKTHLNPIKVHTDHAPLGYSEKPGKK